MNTFFKGLMGAAALLGVSMPMAQAQDYIWSFSLGFYGNERYDDSGPGWSSPGWENGGAGASGLITVTQVSPGLFAVSDFVINTTAGFGGGNDPTNFAMTYSLGAGDSTFTNDDLVDSSVFVAPGDIYLTLTWSTGELIAAMMAGIPGATVEMVPNASIESQYPDYPELDFRRRMSGSCTPDEGEGCATAQQGLMTLEQIIQPEPTPAPEPASMALFGAGLLGLYAARRRRAA